MVLRLWVPPIQRPSARNRNCASEGWSATAAMVANSLGVSTPLRGTGGLRAAGVSMVAGWASMVDLLGRLPTGGHHRPPGTDRRYPRAVGVAAGKGVEF